MPNREADGRVHPKNMTSSWIRDMIEKGLLGPKWWVEKGEIRRDSRDDPAARSPFGAEELREVQRHLRDRLGKSGMKFDGPLPDIDEVLSNIAELMKKELYAPIELEKRRQTRRSKLETAPASKNTDTPQQAAPEGEHLPVPSDSQDRAPSPSQSSSSNAEVPVPVQSKNQSSLALAPAPTPVSAPASASVPTPKASVISTLTTMTSRTLPDGSVETKRVLKKRFADGVEESEESTEVVHPQASTSSLGKTSADEQKKQGWFWT